MRPLGVALVVALSLAGAPDLSEASGRRGGGGHGFSGSGGGHRGHHRGFNGHGHRGFHGHGHRGFHGHGHHHGFHNRFFYYPYYPIYSAPSVVVSNPVVVYTPPVYAAPQYYAPPVAYSAPAAPSVPRVVEYPGGRYELRGDGVSTPYSWVWIPDPPAAPPPPPAPAPPASTAPEPSLALRVAGPRAVAYRWTDESGVTTWTDSLEKVPARFREQASQSAVTQ
jgi:hypothetical protein